MSENIGFLAQNNDLPIAKCQFSAGSLSIGVAHQTLLAGPGGIGPGNAPILSIPGDPTFGGPGGNLAAGSPPALLAVINVPFGGTPPNVNQQAPNIIQQLSKMTVQFLGLIGGSGTIEFFLWVQRLTLLNPVQVADAGIPVFGAPPIAPTKVAGFSSGAMPIVQLAGGVPTQAFVDFSTAPLNVQPGDVFYASAEYTGQVTAQVITNVMLSVG